MAGQSVLDSRVRKPDRGRDGDRDHGPARSGIWKLPQTSAANLLRMPGLAQLKTIQKSTCHQQRIGSKEKGQQPLIRILALIFSE